MRDLRILQYYVLGYDTVASQRDSTINSPLPPLHFTDNSLLTKLICEMGEMRLQ
jgi:hypothetical protein